MKTFPEHKHGGEKLQKTVSIVPGDTEAWDAACGEHQG